MISAPKVFNIEAFEIDILIKSLRNLVMGRVGLDGVIYMTGSEIFENCGHDAFLG